MGTFLGMLGNDDWVTDQRPKNYREGILHLWPNGSAPLTAIMSKMGSNKVDDPEFNWWTKLLASQAGAATNVYIDALMATAYVRATHVAVQGAAGGTVYVKVAEAVADEFRIGHQCLLRDADEPSVDVSTKVTGVVKNAASSYIACRLLEADDNGRTTSFSLATVDRVLVVGNINPEGGEIPTALSYQPTKYSNFTQIFRTPIDITRTARKTKLRTGDQYKELKREALELHSIEMEKAAFFGIATENTGTNGKPERTTQGIIPFVKTNYDTNVMNFNTDTDYNDKTWIEATGGITWLEESLEILFRYGKTDKLAFAGSGALLGIQQLARASGHINITPTSKAFGLKILEWNTPFGTIMIKTHPLFSYEPTNRNSMVFVDPDNMKYRFIDDTFFKKDTSEREGGVGAIDGTKEEFLTEAGYEFHHPETFGVLEGVGLAGPAS